jgi:cyclophilin family peptidyl-prolyl cis-trans isomerase
MAMLKQIMAAALMAATMATGASGSEAVRQPGLTPQRLYNIVGRPAMATLTAPREWTPRQGDVENFITLVLMDVDGRLVDGPMTVQPGEVDLGAALPLIWEIRRACYVQAMIGREPFGSALVLQPLLTRLPPRTEQALRPDGRTPYTRIVGWGTPVKKEPDAAANKEDGKGGNSSAGKPGPAPVEIEPQVFSGLRIYVEQDAVLHTAHGRIVLAMRPDEAPNTVWNFRELVRGGFYDGIIYHRIVPYRRDGHRFVIQAGDPTGTGNGDAGATLPIEPSALPHDFGVISMARDDHPDSAGSQFFIALSRLGTQHLDGQYCSFGHAVEGAEAINAIASAELADVAAGRPKDPPRILRAELIASPPRLIGRGRPDSPVKDTSPVEPDPGRVPR